MSVRVQGFDPNQGFDLTRRMLPAKGTMWPSVPCGSVPGHLVCGVPPLPQPGSSGVFAFLLATVPHLMAHHLIALSIIFPICRMGTVILGSQGVGSINECLEAG